MTATAIAAAEAFCKRFGPGRLPGATNRPFGAGYAFATAALLAAVSYIALVGGSIFTLGGRTVADVAGSWPVLVGVWAVPIVVPSAFVAGALTWRFLPADLSNRGVFGGLIATVLTYAIGVPLAVAVLYGQTLLQPNTTMAGSAFGLVLLIGGYGFLFTCSVTLPVGAVSGYIHERAVAET